MKERTVIIKNERGIHLRPSSVIVQAAQKYRSEIRICKEGKEGSAKEVTDLVVLLLSCGSEVQVKTEGPDEEEALEEISTLLEKQFDFA